MTQPDSGHASPSASLGDRLFALLQYVLPKQLLSRFIYHLMRSESPFVKNLIISNFLRGYQVNMAEAVQPDALAYRSFNDFFTRALRPGVRPVAMEEDVVVSPVDGTMSQRGPLHGESLLQVKGCYYSLTELLAGNAEAIDAYRDGTFSCIYLAPYNYHRIHMPLTGRLRETIYVPGDLFSVNAATARTVPRLFARNERVVCEFAADRGDFALVLVGALFVSSIETVWAGEINPPPRRRGGAQQIAQGHGQSFDKGAEMARFNMGSTVVLIHAPGRMRWDIHLQAGATVRLGQRIGTLTPDVAAR